MNVNDIAFNIGLNVGRRAILHNAKRVDYDEFIDTWVALLALPATLDDPRLDGVEALRINDIVRDGLYEAWAEHRRAQGEDVE